MFFVFFLSFYPFILLSFFLFPLFFFFFFSFFVFRISLINLVFIIIIIIWHQTHKNNNWNLTKNYKSWCFWFGNCSHNDPSHALKIDNGRLLSVHSDVFFASQSGSSITHHSRVNPLYSKLVRYLPAIWYVYLSLRSLGSALIPCRLGSLSSCSWAASIVARCRSITVLTVGRTSARWESSASASAREREGATATSAAGRTVADDHVHQLHNGVILLWAATPARQVFPFRLHCYLATLEKCSI